MGGGREPLFPSHDDVGAWDLARRIEDFPLDVAARGGDGESPWLPLVKTRTEVIDRVLDAAGIELSDVTRVVYNHSSRQHLEDGVLRTLGIGTDRTNWEFGRHLVPGNHVPMLGISPGRNVAGAVVRILEPPSWS